MKELKHKLLRLQGLSFTQELEGQPIDFRNEIVYLSLIPWEVCNWQCKYCHEDRRYREKDELTTQECLRIIAEARQLGIKSLLLLGGEVVIDDVWEQTCRIVEAAYKQNIIPLIYTNGSQLTIERAKWLADHNTSIALKVDSLQSEKYDFITGRTGNFDQTMKAIDIVKKTSIGEVVSENDDEKLVRLLITTVGNALNIDEYVSLARFATTQGARWMMESLNHRGEVDSHPEFSLDISDHSEAMRLTMALNPEQDHEFHKPCRLLSCVTIRKKGEVVICPQDYDIIENIRTLGSLDQAVDLVKRKVDQSEWRASWNGACPLKRRPGASFNKLGGSNVIRIS